MTFGCGEFTVTDAAAAAAANAPRRADDCNDCTELKVNDSCVRLNSAQSTSQQLATTPPFLPSPPLPASQPACLPAHPIRTGQPTQKSRSVACAQKIVANFSSRFWA